METRKNTLHVCSQTRSQNWEFSFIPSEAKASSCDGDQTALVLALESWDASAVEQLLNYGADPNQTGRLLSGLGRKPFAFLMKQVIVSHKPLKEAVKFAELLARFGADVNVPLTGDQETALHLFADECNVEGVELLRRLHAKTDIKSEHEETAKEAAEYAASNGKCKTTEEKKRFMKAFDLEEKLL